MATSKKFQLENIMAKINECEEKLCYVDNNLRYIKCLQSFKLWLSRLATLQNTVEYQAYFYTGCGFSTWDRVNNSILEYEYGNRPF